MLAYWFFICSITITSFGCFNEDEVGVVVNLLFMVTVHHCMLSCSYSNNIFSFFSTHMVKCQALESKL